MTTCFVRGHSELLLSLFVIWCLNSLSLSLFAFISCYVYAVCHNRSSMFTENSILCYRVCRASCCVCLCTSMCLVKFADSVQCLCILFLLFVLFHRMCVCVLFFFLCCFVCLTRASIHTASACVARSSRGCNSWGSSCLRAASLSTWRWQRPNRAVSHARVHTHGLVWRLQSPTELRHSTRMRTYTHSHIHIFKRTLICLAFAVTNEAGPVFSCS